MARLKLTKYICIEKNTREMAKKLVDKNKKSLVCIGSTRTEQDCTVRRYTRTPSPRLLQALEDVPNITVLEIDEHDDAGLY